MEYSTESKVSGPETDKPANCLRFLRFTMSHPRFLVPGSYMSWASDTPGTLAFVSLKP